MFNYDVPAFYAKICDDMQEAQTADGLVPDIAPEYTVFPGGFRDSPEWGSAYVIDPWHVYQMYGDATVLAKHYEGMKKYVAYLGGKSKDHIVSHGLGDWADYGPNPPGESQLTSRGLTATAIYYQDITILRTDGPAAGQAGRRREVCQAGRRGAGGLQQEHSSMPTRTSTTATARPPTPCRWCWDWSRKTGERPCWRTW